MKRPKFVTYRYVLYHWRHVASSRQNTGSPPLLSDVYWVYVCWMEHEGLDICCVDPGKSQNVMGFFIRKQGTIKNRETVIGSTGKKLYSAGEGVEGYTIKAPRPYNGGSRSVHLDCSVGFCSIQHAVWDGYKSDDRSVEVKVKRLQQWFRTTGQFEKKKRKLLRELGQD